MPFPTPLAAFTMVLPPVSGLAFEQLTRWVRRTQRGSGIGLVHLAALTALTIYITVVATLSGTFLPSRDPTTCFLENQWRHLFQNKDERRIRTIQDTFSCCGFRTVLDMPWPFPSRHHGVEAATCTRQTQRKSSCLAPWMSEQQAAAGILLAVACGVFAWVVVALAVTMRHRASDASRFEELAGDEDQSRSRRRTAVLEYRNSAGGDEMTGGTEEQPGDRRITETDEQMALLRTPSPSRTEWTA